MREGGKRKKKTARSKRSWCSLNSPSVGGGVFQSLPVLHTARLQESLDARDAHWGQAGEEQVLATECPEQVLMAALCALPSVGIIQRVLWALCSVPFPVPGTW